VRVNGASAGAIPGNAVSACQWVAPLHIERASFPAAIGNPAATREIIFQARNRYQRKCKRLRFKIVFFKPIAPIPNISSYFNIRNTLLQNK